MVLHRPIESTIVFGGGLGQRMLSHQAAIRRGLETWAINPQRQQVAMVAAHYGSESALVGAAALCMRRSQVWNPRKSAKSANH
jgi:hypothetical protein